MGVFGALVHLTSVWLTHALLKAHRQLLKFLVAIVELLLNLLQFGLKANVLVFRDIVGDFEVSVVILKIFLLHLHKVVETLCLWLLLDPKDHFSQLLALKLIELATSDHAVWSHHHRPHLM